MILKELPFIIAGPCTAESEEQVFNTAVMLKNSGKVNIYRAGVWKPRTMPNTYEGPGEIGLKWLSKVKNELNLEVTTEVATPKHVELALENNINWQWIGARTTVNPFSMAALASALKNTNVTVMIKNPINADISLWIGAIERIKKAGIKNIIAIHRGFTSLSPDPYRFDPIWKIPLEVKKYFPDIPIICDPSHLTGNSKYIKQISQKALDLNMSGLMLEVHNDPPNALVDKKQQITPHDFIELIDHLITRKENSSNQSYQNKLKELRQQIDILDHNIIDHLSDRMNIVKEIAKLKFDNNIGPFQLDRFQEFCKERSRYGISNGLSKELINELFNTIHEDAVKLQSDLMETF